MADADRALDLHEVGETPKNSRSIPVVYKGSGPVIPAAPVSGTVVLTSTDGVLSWEDAA